MVSGLGVSGVVAVSLVQPLRPSEVLERVRKSLAVDKVELPSFDALSFGRMVLKSAYALTVAEFGLNRTREPLAVPAILGSDHDLGNLFGSTPDVCAPENAQHITQIKTFKSERDDQNYRVSDD